MNFKTNSRGGWIVPAGTVIPDDTNIPTYSEVGDGCTLGNWCKLGDGCTLGNRCTLGNWCTLGNGCMLGNGCTLEGLIARHWLTLSNVDGSGRQVLIVSDGEQTLIRAGCFLGTPAEFTKKAASEGKHIYAAVIPAVIAAMGVPS